MSGNSHLWAHLRLASGRTVAPLAAFFWTIICSAAAAGSSEQQQQWEGRELFSCVQCWDQTGYQKQVRALWHYDEERQVRPRVTLRESILRDKSQDASENWGGSRWRDDRDQRRGQNHRQRREHRADEAGQQEIQGRVDHLHIMGYWDHLNGEWNHG